MLKRTFNVKFYIIAIWINLNYQISIGYPKNMLDQFKYRNSLLRKYLFIALITSIFISPVYYYLSNFNLAITLNLFSIGIVYLFFRTKNGNDYIVNSRIFMVFITILFIVGLIHGNQQINSSFFLLLYPIASFSIRGPKEGILWSFILLLVFINLFFQLELQYNNYSFFFFFISYLMISYLLYFYRYYELRTFQKINEQLEETVKQRTRELELSNQKLQTLASTDALTKLFNRAKLDESIQNEINRAQRFKHSLGLILLDIDHFKHTNDTYGHDIGDKVLQEFSDILKQYTRDTDIVGRWGGEEFLIICPETDLEGLKKLAQGLRDKIEKYPFSIVKHKTSSFGLTLYQEGNDLKDLVKKADQALYSAKEKGRNRIEIFI